MIKQIITSISIGIILITTYHFLFANEKTTFGALSKHSGFYVATSSQFGIGTSTPAAVFDIYDTSTSSLYIYSGGVGLGGQIIFEKTDGSGCVALRIDANGSFSTTTITCSDSANY